PVYFCFYLSYTAFQFLNNLFIPETQHSPTLIVQFFIHFFIPFHVPLYFFMPEFCICLNLYLLGFPVLPVPEFAVHEYGKFQLFKGNVRCTGYCLIVLPVAVSFGKKCNGEYFLRFGTGRLVALHTLPSLFGG